MGKLELVILGASLFVAASGLSLPSLSFFGSDDSKLESIDDGGKAEKVPENLDGEKVFSTLHLPGLPGIPLPPMPPVPAFLQRPAVKATKTVVIEVTHYEKTHPVCWTVDPKKPPCDSHASNDKHHYDQVVINPTSTVHLIKPTVNIKNPFQALNAQLKPLLPTIEKPSAEPVAEPSSQHLEASEPVVEKSEDMSAAESREGRYIQFGTPAVNSAANEVKINDAPEESVAAVDVEKDSRVIGKFGLIGRPNTIYETKTIYATKTEKVPDLVTATLIVDNCVPVDAAIPKCKPPQPLVDNYGQNYEAHFDDFEENDNTEKGRLTFLKKLIAQQAALAEGGAHYAAQIAAQHAAYHAALAHRFHSTAAQIAQNNANNALAAENAALESAHHHHEAEHAAHENLVSILKKYTRKGQLEQQQEEQQEGQHQPQHQQQQAQQSPQKQSTTTSTTAAPKPSPAGTTDDHWRIVAEGEEY